MDSCLEIIYNNGKHAEDVVYLCYGRPPGQKVGHFDAIVNIQGFFSKRFYCKDCDVAHKSPSGHQCHDIADSDWCFACFRRACVKEGLPIPCEVCKRPLWSEECRDRHHLMKCHKKWQCPQCRNWVLRQYELLGGKKKRYFSHEEMLDYHKCDHYYCFECEEEVPDDHRCYIKPKELKTKLFKYLFFDFETTQSTKVHIVNYIHVRYFKPDLIEMMQFPGCNLRFIDSFNFLPMALAKLPGAFGLPCGGKGYFPHFANSPENWNYVGELPDSHYYGVSLMSTSEKKQFDTWYAEQKEKQVVFNFKEELAAYCQQDVEILQQSCMAYRKLMCTVTNCDPFAYITLASVCSAVYLSTFMPKDSIARVPPSGYHNYKYSSEAFEWVEYLRTEQGFPSLRHAANGGEVWIGKFRVDGYDLISNTVFEYLGCFHHGCPQCNSDKEIKNPDTRKRISTAYKATQDRIEVLSKMGYHVETKWACQWKKEKEGDPDLADTVQQMEIPRPLNPRDAFFGGRTEAFYVYSNKAPIALRRCHVSLPLRQLKDGLPRWSPDHHHG
jgi:hypothetical protein